MTLKCFPKHHTAYFTEIFYIITVFLVARKVFKTTQHHFFCCCKKKNGISSQRKILSKVQKLLITQSPSSDKHESLIITHRHFNARIPSHRTLELTAIFQKTCLICWKAFANLSVPSATRKNCWDKFCICLS